MNHSFPEIILRKHQQAGTFPLTSDICQLVTRVLLLLFPEQSKNQYKNSEDIQNQLKQYESDLTNLLTSMESYLASPAKELASEFMKELPLIYDKLLLDIQAILNGDPAARSEFEVIRAYPGFYAIGFYRLANVMYRLEIPLIPRILTEYAHSKTGIDIHPGATIGNHFYIDHGTGIVIGETAIIGDNVKVYQGVTLGALSVSKEKADTKRHPSIEDNVVIYSGATILGGETVVGHDSIIGGNVWLTESVPAYTRVYHKAQIEVNTKKVN
jgi:serine O-acetyltransferase